MTLGLYYKTFYGRNCCIVVISFATAIHFHPSLILACKARKALLVTNTAA